MNYSKKWNPAILLALLAACGPKSTSSSDEVLNQPQSGVVDVDVAPDGSTVTEQIVANFLNVPSNETCAITTSGACTLINCPVAASSDQSSAGNLTVTNGSNKATIFPQSGDPIYVRSPVEPNIALLISPGKPLTVSAMGSTVPAFSTTLTGPSPVTVTAPMNTSLTIDHTQPLAVSWTGTTAGNVVFELTGPAPANNPTLDCEFSGNATSGTVPSAALSLLTAGNYQAGIFSQTSNVISNSGWAIEVNANYQAKVAGGVPFKVSATVQ